MGKYSCEKCAKTFSQKSHYDKHISRKNPCEIQTDKIKALIDKALDEKLIELNIKLKLNNTTTESNIKINITEQMDISKMSKINLLQKCKELGITKCSSKNKLQLIELINSNLKNNTEEYKNILISEDIIDNEPITEKLNVVVENEINNETTTQIIKLPNTRFQGSKKKIINRIYDLMITNFKPIHILDLFGGSSICSLYFHMNNIEVTYNDILRFNSINANGLLDVDLNNIPSEEEIKNIFVKNSDSCYTTFIYDTFKDIYYTDNENRELDIFRENIKHYTNIKQNIFYYLLFQSLISKRPYNLFHRKNLSIRTADVERNFGNKTTWEKPFIEHMLTFRKELIKLYEQKKMIDTGNTHIINMPYNKITDEIISQIDTIYIDPPYFKKDCKDSQYFDNYHFLEGFISESWDTIIDYSTKHLKLKTSADYIIENANKMFDNIIDKYGNKNLVISYNTKAFPSISEIETKLKKKYSNVITKYTDYNYALSKTKSQEVVILALVT
jgi:adenine-specific DNA methylase